MDPLITNGIDPALLRVIEKRGQERDPQPRRRRTMLEREKPDDSETEAEEIPKHELDDLA